MFPIWMQLDWVSTALLFGSAVILVASGFALRHYLWSRKRSLIILAVVNAVVWTVVMLTTGNVIFGYGRLVGQRDMIQQAKPPAEFRPETPLQTKPSVSIKL